uniref:Amine oxidase domain-containing protein n=1 Tax=Zooxanthella nutricula TaxID=1333877 RepID=A0A7S2VKF8_9DINO
MDFAAGRYGAFRMERQGQDDGSEVYNELHAHGRCVHRYRPGPETFQEDITQKFPQEEQAIRRFLASVQLASLGSVIVLAKQFIPKALWGTILALPGIKHIVRSYIRRTLAEALTDCGVKDPVLRDIFSAEFGDHGMVPEKAPFFLHAGILAHYMPEGGFSPVRGSDSFALALVPTVLDAGGAVFVRAPVAKVVEENGRVVGVEMAGGKGVVRAKRSVISAAGVEVTYRRLLDEVTVAKIGGPPQSLLAAEQKGHGGSSHHMYGFFGFDGSAKDLNLPTYNIWSMLPTVAGTSSLSASWQSLFGTSPGTKPTFLTDDAAAAEAQLPCFISFPSAKDSAFEARCPGKSTAVLITESRAEYFGDVGPTGKRGEEYNRVKKRYEELLLKAMYRHFPHLEGKLAYSDIGTPHSNEHYLGRFASYGLDQDADRFLDPTLRVAVPGLEGLYLTGQDIALAGVFPQFIAAWVTFAKVVGVTSLDFWLLFADFAATFGWRSAFDSTYAPTNK